MTGSRRHAARAGLIAALCLGLAAVGGCGKAKSTVKGKVSYQGKPVVWGSVTLIGSDNVQYVGDITPEGTYSVANVPTGPVKLGVSSPNPNAGERRPKRGGPGTSELGGDRTSAPGEKPKPAPGKWFEIPMKFADPTTSGLTGEVKSSSETTVDLELK
jgi:hypothetical protein